MNEPTRSEGYGHGPSTIRLGDLEVQRMGYGAMRLPGKDVWGEPDDPARARKVLRRAVELGSTSSTPRGSTARSSRTS